MAKRLVSLKSVFLALALVAAFSFSTVFAAAPSISDSGSAYWTARVSGSGFTSSTYFSTRRADVWILNVDSYGNQSWVSRTVNLSSASCNWFYCFGRGTFSVEINMAPLQCGSRSAIAYDQASGLWSYWIPLQCS
jgi:hypothetical protein